MQNSLFRETKEIASLDISLIVKLIGILGDFRGKSPNQSTAFPCTTLFFSVHSALDCLSAAAGDDKAFPRTHGGCSKCTSMEVQTKQNSTYCTKYLNKFLMKIFLFKSLVNTMASSWWGRDKKSDKSQYLRPAEMIAFHLFPPLPKNPC